MNDGLWAAARAAASDVAPAATWRLQLAQRILEATGSAWVTVSTCPPDRVHEASVTTLPTQRVQLVDRINSEFLGRIERGGDGSMLARLIGTAAYAPLSDAGNRRLAQELRRELLEPAGIRDLVNLYLTMPDRSVIGWISVGTQESARDALAGFGAHLSDVGAIAASTLQGVVDLASSVGAKVPSGRGIDLHALSPREREIARLVAVGLSDVNIARRLEISEDTVGSHLRRIFAKLSIHSRVELATMATGTSSEVG